MAKLAFRAQVLRAREAAIVAAAKHLLAAKGFDAMTVDEVAAEAGIAKASLYKHFDSKEAVAAAAMTRVVDTLLAALDELAAQASPDTPPLERLKAAMRWALQLNQAGELPALPAPNSSLLAALAAHAGYCERLAAANERVGAWVGAAQASGELNPELPAQALLWTLAACACGPLPGLLRRGGTHSDEQIAEFLLATCFDGLTKR